MPMMICQMDLIKYAHKTCIEFFSYEFTSDHASDQIHFHSTIEIAYIKEGHGVYRVDNENYNINPGDIFVFNSMQQHNVIYISPDERLKTLVINFDPEFIAPMESSDYDLQYLDSFLYTGRPSKLDSQSPYAHQIKDIMLSMQKEFEDKKQCYQLMVKSQLLSILTILLRCFNESGQGKKVLEYPVHNQDSIATVLTYIDQNISNDLNIELLSEVVHMNRYYFSTFFKKYVGETPIQYITRKRVALAIHLLKTTNLNILDVATESGFNNAANFNRVFKQMVGRTPTEFRKEYIGEKSH